MYNSFNYTKGGLYIMENTFKYWADCHVEMKQGEGVGQSRLYGIRNDITNLSVLHGMPIKEITLLDIQRHINSLNLSKKTLTGIRNTAKAVFQLAIDSMVADYNPVTSVKIPRNAKVSTREGITEEQQRWLLDTPHRAQILALIMLFTGLRRGEVVALTWDDIDFEKRQLEVNKAVEFIKNQPVIKSPKTKAGTRKIFLPEILSERLLIEKRKSISEFIVTSATNQMLTKIACKRLWQSYMHDLNIKYGHNGNVKKCQPKKIQIKIKTFTMHQLRHTYASMLYFAEIDVMTARDYLGHANIQTTLNIYTHLDKKHLNVQAIKLDDYIEKAF